MPGQRLWSRGSTRAARTAATHPRAPRRPARGARPRPRARLLAAHKPVLRSRPEAQGQFENRRKLPLSAPPPAPRPAQRRRRLERTKLAPAVYHDSAPGGTAEAAIARRTGPRHRSRAHTAATHPSPLHVAGGARRGWADPVPADHRGRPPPGAKTRSPRAPADPEQPARAAAAAAPAPAAPARADVARPSRHRWRAAAGRCARREARFRARDVAAASAARPRHHPAAALQPHTPAPCRVLLRAHTCLHGVPPLPAQPLAPTPHLGHRGRRGGTRGRRRSAAASVQVHVGGV
mmetsp:Transcript_3601/g.10587  ORF Transcript_3601/g.10587 Transcript_3601/m.10587 type:complete len:292 (+) Transcript_3601:160-1035(+)